MVSDLRSWSVRCHSRAIQLECMLAPALNVNSRMRTPHAAAIAGTMTWDGRPLRRQTSFSTCTANVDRVSQ